MFKRFGKYIIGKVSGSVIGRVVKWGFWPAIYLVGPATIGIQGIAVAAIVVHSGIVEYTASKAVDKAVDKVISS